MRKPLNQKKKRLFYAVLVCMVVVSGIVAAEVATRFAEALWAPAAPPSARLDYKHAWTNPPVLGRGGFLKPHFKAYVKDGLGGEVRWQNNSHGFRNDREFSRFPRASVVRIISIGDSFTAGMRVGQEDTFSYLLEQWLRKNRLPAEVLISCTEDPVYGHEWLKRYGADYKPDIVLMGVTLGNDIAQSYIRLHPRWIGFRKGLKNLFAPERCHIRTDGDALPGRAPGWSLNVSQVMERFPLSRIRALGLLRRVLVSPSAMPQAIFSWGHSDLPPGRIRLFDACDGLGMFIKDSPGIIDEAYHRLFRTLEATKAFADSRGIVVVLMLFPQRYQVQSPDWCETIRAYQLNPDAFDLNGPNRRIREFCERNAIPLIDPLHHMKQTWDRDRVPLYLPGGDMHWNREGHKVFFDSAKERVADIVRGIAAGKRSVARSHNK